MSADKIQKAIKRLYESDLRFTRELSASDIQKAWEIAKTHPEVSYVPDVFFDILIEELKLYPVSKRK